MKFIKPFLYLFFILMTGFLISCSQTSASQENEFKKFIESVKKEASQLGVSQNTIDRYLNNVKLPKPLKKTPEVKEQTHQAQAELTFQEYLNRLVPEGKKRRAKREFEKNKTALWEVSERYHVQPQIIVALWGLESDFGDDMGDFPLIDSLAILAFHHHRSSFYRRQLIDALRILDAGPIIPQMLKSSFDGGMGQIQFEPETYMSYAVDFNGDGFKNIWTNLPDSFASIANFLQKNGWDGDQTWGIEVKLPDNFNKSLAGRDNKKSISFWKKQGVTQLNGQPLKDIKGKAAILLPDDIKGPAFLVYPNFYVLLRWNDTTFEGLAAGLLANSI